MRRWDGYSHFESDADKSPCYLQYYEMSYLAQQAGATAVIFSGAQEPHDYHIYLLTPCAAHLTL
jgi:hypothetical protein